MKAESEDGKRKKVGKIEEKKGRKKRKDRRSNEVVR